MKKRSKNHLAGQALKKALQTACKDVIYISETDAAIEPVLVSAAESGPLVETATALINSKFKIEEHSAKDFLAKLTAKKDWHSESEKIKIDRFVKLRELLELNLRDITLFRAGRIKIDILVLGFDVDGNVAGIRTKAVET